VGASPGSNRPHPLRNYGATLTRSATRPRLVAAVGASSRGVAQALFPAIQPRPAGPRYPASSLGSHPRPWLAGGCAQAGELTIGPRQLRGGVAAAEAPPARPTHGESRSAEQGCTGRARRCSHPRRKFGFRRRRAPSVQRRRRGVGHCASAPPCLDCSPTQAGQTLLGLAIPRRSGSLWSRRVGCHLPGPPRLWCWVRWLGWASWAWHEGLGLPGPTRGRLPGQPGSAGRSRGAGVPASPRAARPSIPAWEVAWP